MARRIHVHILACGDLPLDSIQAHHARDVLRLPSGEEVIVFDDAGATARGIFVLKDAREAAVRVTSIDSTSKIPALQWTVASAVPKGDRADWMVEKLSELGTTTFIPLAAARSVVLPEGKGKRERWMRIATEAAKQSRRLGVMRIQELTPLNAAIARVQIATNGDSQHAGRGWVMSAKLPARPIAEVLLESQELRELTLFIGPEGGWTESELAAFQSAGIVPVCLGTTTLRVETAAVTISAIVSSMLAK